MEHLEILERKHAELRLSGEEEKVLCLLQKAENEKIPVSRWYLGALFVLRNESNPDRFSQAAQSIREIFEKLPRISIEFSERTQFKQLRNNLIKSLEKVKKNNPKWEECTINKDLVSFLRNVEEYLELSQSEASRSVAITEYANKNDELSGFLGGKLTTIRASHYMDVWKKLELFAHHQIDTTKNNFIELFEQVNQIILDILAPTVAENQLEIQAILQKKSITDHDKERIKSLLLRKGANLKFFLETATTSLWFDFLLESSLIVQPITDNNSQQYIVQFLHKIIVCEPQKATDYVLTITNCNNPHLLFEISMLATKIDDVALSIKYCKFIRSFIGHSDSFSPIYEIFTPLVEKWGKDTKGLSKLLSLINQAIAFDEDNSSAYPKIRARIGLWDYEQVLENVVKPLSRMHPYDVSTKLLDITNKMIELRTDKFKPTFPAHDSSESWCPNIVETKDEYSRTEESFLVHALVYACEQVYCLQENKISELDRYIKKFPWMLMLRLRFHLYAKFLSFQTLPWISMSLLDHSYESNIYSYEFQKCIRKACEYYKHELLTGTQLKIIIEKILTGPSASRFKGLDGNKVSENECTRIKEYFYLRQLHPFLSILPDEAKEYYNTLESLHHLSLNDDSYSDALNSTSGFIQSRSPKSIAELVVMSDEEILFFINSWKDSISWHGGDADTSQEGSFFEITYQGLANELKKFFVEKVLLALERLDWWEKHYCEINHPIYINAIMEAYLEAIKNENFQIAEKGLILFDFILHQNQKSFGSLEEVEVSPIDAYTTTWREVKLNSMRYLRSFINSEKGSLVQHKNLLINLFEYIYTQSDEWLDMGKSIFTDEIDYLTDAINNVRSDFIGCIISYAQILSEKNDTESIGKILAIFDKRLVGFHKSSLPLTPPEYAMFTSRYIALYNINRNWTEERREYLFPIANSAGWIASFSSFLARHQEHRFFYEELKVHFVLAIDKLPDWLEENGRIYYKLIENLGRYLYYFYMCNCYSMTGEDSLLASYYSILSKKSEYKAILLDALGDKMKKTGTKMPDEFVTPSKEFLEWRILENDIIELQKITRWLDAECFDARWRLDQFIKVLDLGYKVERFSHITIQIISKMYEYEKFLTLECLEKLLQKAPQNLYLDSRIVKPMLYDSIESQDKVLIDKGKHIQNFLLSQGRNEYLELEASLTDKAF